MSTSNYEIQLISTRLKEQRKKNKITQQEIADMLGVSRDTVTAYENENNPRLPSALQLRKLSGIYNVSVDYLVGISKIESDSKRYVISYELNLSIKCIDYLLDLVKKKNDRYICEDEKNKINAYFDMFEQYLSKDYEEINLLLSDIKKDAEYYALELKNNNVHGYTKKRGIYKKLKSIRHSSYDAYDLIMQNLLNPPNLLDSKNLLDYLKEEETKLSK